MAGRARETTAADTTASATRNGRRRNAAMFLKLQYGKGEIMRNATTYVPAASATWIAREVSASCTSSTAETTAPAAAA